jgi:hypothetical protein
VGAWYTIGLAVGLGVAFGILAAALLPRWIVAALLAALAGGALAFLAVEGWGETVAGVAGGAAGGTGAAPVVQGALRRGGTRGGLALFGALAAVAAAALAFVPVVGYLEGLALPLLGRRARSREPERHAGLRTLARD